MRDQSQQLKQAQSEGIHFGKGGKKTLWIIEAAGKFMWAVFRAYGFPERLNLN